MNLLEMSFYGAVMILVIVIIRALVLYKLPKKFFLILWGVVLLRLLVPFEISSGLSIYSHVPKGISEHFADTSDTAIMPSDSIPRNDSEPVSTDFTYPPYVGIVNLPEALQKIDHGDITAPDMQPMTATPTANSVQPITIPPGKTLRFCGTLFTALLFAIAYIKCYSEFRTSLPVQESFAAYWLEQHPLKRRISIRQSDKISAPLTYGVFRPVILLPKNTNWEDQKQLEYILYHEYTHIYRFDLVTKLLMIIALCLHWFNPFVWVMYLLFNQDIELACDESVVQHLAAQEKSAYARTLINMEEKKLYLAPLCNNFSKNAIEERITAIMKLKKTTLGTILGGVLLVGIVITTLMTSAAKTTNSVPGVPTPFPTVTATPTPTPGDSLHITNASTSQITPKDEGPETLLDTDSFPQIGICTPTYLNVRYGAGHEYPIITKLPCASIVEVLSATQDKNGEYWYAFSLTISGEKQTGYIHSQYVLLLEDGILVDKTPEELMASGSFPKNGSLMPKKLNVREGAGYDYPILTQLEQLTQVNIMEKIPAEDGETWYYVSFSQKEERKTGYVNSLYVRITDDSYPEGIVYTQIQEDDFFLTLTEKDFPREGLVSAENLRVRKGPGYTYDIISYIFPSTSIQILSQQTAEDGSHWYKISYSQSNTSQTGYVDAQYISTSAPTPKE